MSAPTRRISRILVANRGEIARRVMRTAAAMGIETVAVYSSGDADAPFVAEADLAVALGGRTATESYLDVEKVLAAAARAGADAVHPGYGFLSENAGFAEAVEAAGLAWIGPPPAAIAAMGDKLEAKRLMIDAGVPTLPSVELTGSTDLAAAADEIGYPVLIKAAAGGGGKGMRVVARAAELEAAVEGARREALNSFGNDTVFLEKYLPAPRHIEVQVLGDTHGNLLHCFERECSIQRRHQKVVEEAPSPALDDELRDRMGSAATDAVAAIGYHSAGTVEFLLDDSDNRFYFLEVNTRLQVEHPVTEEITGLDLVRQMIRVAEGRPLDFTQDDLTIDGHAIEVRLYAEDPANDFLPAVGTLRAWSVPEQPEVRVDSGVVAGSEVGVEFDPMLAKVIAHAPTRTEAAQRLALVLERMLIAGVTTNRDFLAATLRTPEFLAGATQTDFIDRVAPAPRFTPDDATLATALTAAVLARQAANRRATPQLGFMRSGYRNSVMPPQSVSFVHGDRELTVSYRSRRDDRFDVWIDDADPIEAFLVGEQRAGEQRAGERSPGEQVTAVIDGLRADFDVVQAGLDWQIQTPQGAVELRELPRFADLDGEATAGGQAAPMPGAIRVVAVEVGDEVAAGQTLVVMEAMKMEHTITAPDDAVVAEVRCAVGDQVDNGQVLVVLQGVGEG